MSIVTKLDSDAISAVKHECSICLVRCDSCKSPITLQCGHTFHEYCILSWESQDKDTCPLCRAVFDPSLDHKIKEAYDILTSYLLFDDLIDLAIADLNEKQVYTRMSLFETYLMMIDCCC